MSVGPFRLLDRAVSHLVLHLPGWTLRQWVRGPARKVRWGCSGLGAEQRVGGGWSPVTVAAQVEARSGGAGLRNALAVGGVGQWSITWSWSGTWGVIQKSERA